MTQRLTIAIILLFVFNFMLGTAQSDFRLRRELETTVDPIPCNAGTSGPDCTCPGKCLTYYNSTGGCHPNDCWKWDNVNDHCEVAGKDFVAPLILQSIPVTGAFGAGWGNIGRWDIFKIYMAVIFGPLAIVMLSCCCVMGGFCSQNEDRLECYHCLSHCFGCLWSVMITVMWIWGIVVIANKPLAPWTDWEGNAIECALVG